jgi:ribonuclease P protein component
MAQTFSATERVRRRLDFDRAYTQGLKVPRRFMTIFLLRTRLTASRLGIAATRKLGNAVERNRAKRLVREVFRRHKPPAGLDIVIVPRRELLSAEFASLERDYQSVLASRQHRAPLASAHRLRPRKR